MRVVTLYAPGEEMGRTTVAMALASALVAQGRRVLVLDATDGPGSWSRNGRLRNWKPNGHWQGPDRYRLVVAPSLHPYQLADRLAWHENWGTEIALVDVARRLDVTGEKALLACDLVIVPFTDAEQAVTANRAVAEGVVGGRDARGRAMTVRGLPTGLPADEAHAAATRAAFEAAPLMRAELPRAELFREPMSKDYLPHAMDERASLLGRGPGAKYEPPSNFALGEADRRAWAGASAVAAEAWWLAQGLDLVARERDEVRTIAGLLT